MHLVDEARGLDKIRKTDRWAHINAKLLRLFFIFETILYAVLSTPVLRHAGLIRIAFCMSFQTRLLDIKTFTSFYTSGSV